MCSATPWAEWAANACLPARQPAKAASPPQMMMISANDLDDSQSFLFLCGIWVFLSLVSNKGPAHPER